MKTSYAAKSNVAKASRTTEKYYKKKSKMRQQTKKTKIFNTRMAGVVRNTSPAFLIVFLAFYFFALP